MDKKKVIIGSRGSDLALWQAHFMQDELRAIGHDSEVIVIKTQGDRVQDLTFDKLEGKGFFTKEIEDQLLAGAIDVAVHSMKDLPTTSPDGLLIAGVSYREEPTDTLLIKKEAVDTGAPLRISKRAVAERTNVERKVLQKMDGGCQLPLGVYCEQDRNQNYHVYAAMGTDDGVRRAKASSSTTFHLAEEIYSQLMTEA